MKTDVVVLIEAHMTSRRPTERGKFLVMQRPLLEALTYHLERAKAQGVMGASPLPAVGQLINVGGGGS
jgi:hypothetical protein